MAAPSSTPSVEEVRAATNLNVLRRIDGDIVSVLVSARHVVVYAYDEARGSWQKGDVEGSLFVVARRTVPHHCIVVLNRRGQHNLVENVSDANFRVHLQMPYLMYRNAQRRVTGLWFFSDDERDVVHAQLQAISQQLSAAPPTPA
eukprot:CAMPEP_0198350990 /NCGR_PEP_ID=MMETSP1450-20131203/101154_1 /TAXON_ID=753684 ORGANISM="Madagascaria erythrocladiodes, Strain CCMP3234" /NCGR_SAMPLE_ID=MMETSP1450 /ASSEMBLY_ACC=CAM_ASM_001115 /LENGTH=144 /DNA_ID=CAMNT_0044056865 /DNA_START=56 /DNA_END=487 /DNA_ORIENTATION=+